MGRLILVRHGESVWNKQNLFTGWVDVPLSLNGIEEATKAGLLIQNLPVDVIFTSKLIRAQMTAFIAMLYHSSGKVPVLIHEDQTEKEWGKIYSSEIEASTIPVFASSFLNERMYGTLQGLNKKELMEKYGEAQVKKWRRSYDISPPGGESLEMTCKRTLPYFFSHIIPFLKEGKNVFISAHGNSLRSIVMWIESLTPEEVINLELATGAPIVYTFRNEKFEKTAL